jgi:hypothetical protein
MGILRILCMCLLTGPLPVMAPVEVERYPGRLVLTTSVRAARL